jgi:hypothetical protein
MAWCKGTGPGTVGVSAGVPMILTVTCTDQQRGTFVDVSRAGVASRRVEIDPGATEAFRVLPGPVDLKFGAALAYTFEAEGDGDEVVS